MILPRVAAPADREAAAGAFYGLRVLLAIDQGTTGTTCLVLDDGFAIRGRGYRELMQYFPSPGLVEHDADEIWETVLAAAEAALADAGIGVGELRALGIANQRETTLLWNRSTGRPLGRALVWQDRRTAARCAELPVELIRERTGLVPDPYFSATKLEWLLARTGAAGDLAFGTVDSWLVWKLTGEHLTDVSNASRTMLLDLTRWPGMTSCSRSSASRARCCPGSSRRAASSARPVCSGRACR